MSVYFGKINVKSHDHMPTFHDVTKQVKAIVEQSGIKNGVVTVYSHHTTCSVIIQECSHDTDFYGREFLQVDLVNVMEKLIPTCLTENQYRHPGPKHIEFALGIPGEEPKYGLNTDGHLRSSIFGRSECIPLENGKVSLGQFGYVYFVDWDQVRERERVCEVVVMGE